MKDLMITYKHILILLTCVTSMISMNAMEKKRGADKKAASKDVDVSEWLNKLLDVDTDSIVFQRGKTVLLDPHYNDNPILLAAYVNFFAEFIMYKVGEEIYYNMFIEECASNESERIDFVYHQLSSKQDNAWQKEKKDILKEDDLNQVRKKIYRDFEFFSEIEDEYTKMNIAAHKKWMFHRNFASTKFLVETICEQMGERNLIDSEMAKVIEVLKRYDNK